MSMHALVLNRYHGPLEMTELSRPRPSQGQVLVRIAASGLNPLDTKIRAGSAEHAKHPLPLVLGIDMAHMGRRYGDRFEAIAEEREMLAVDARDRQRMDCVAAGDATGFWDLVQENHDDLKWCGSSPLYTFLKVMPQARGSLKRYEQWNIDPQSVVSFAGMSFRI